VVDLYAGRNPLMGGMSQTGIRDKAFQLFSDYLSQEA